MQKTDFSMREFEVLLTTIRSKLKSEFDTNLVSSNVPDDMKLEAMKKLLETFENAAGEALKLAQTRMADMAVKQGDSAMQVFTVNSTFKVKFNA
jgi:beta-lactamase class D